MSDETAGLRSPEELKAALEANLNRKAAVGSSLVMLYQEMDDSETQEGFDEIQLAMSAMLTIQLHMAKIGAPSDFIDKASMVVGRMRDLELHCAKTGTVPDDDHELAQIDDILKGNEA